MCTVLLRSVAAAVLESERAGGDAGGHSEGVLPNSKSRKLGLLKVAMGKSVPHQRTSTTQFGLLGSSKLVASAAARASNQGNFESLQVEGGLIGAAYHTQQPASPMHSDIHLPQTMRTSTAARRNAFVAASACLQEPSMRGACIQPQDQGNKKCKAGATRGQHVQKGVAADGGKPDSEADDEQKICSVCGCATSSPYLLACTYTYCPAVMHAHPVHVDCSS